MKSNQNQYNATYYRVRYKTFFLSRIGISNVYYLWTVWFCLIKRAQLKKGNKVLDFGCGIGNLVWALRKFGIEAFGIDPSIPAKKFCREPNYCTYRSTQKLPYTNNEFDLVYSSEVLEHIEEENIEHILKETWRVSKGTMIHMIGVKDRGKIVEHDPTHLTVKTEDWWKEKFKKLGFTVQNGNMFYFFRKYLPVK